MAAGNALLDEALRAQGSGRAREAAQLYRHVLEYNPDDLVALKKVDSWTWPSSFCPHRIRNSGGDVKTDSNSRKFFLTSHRS